MRNIKHKITEKYLFKSGHSGTVAFVTVKFDFVFFYSTILVEPLCKAVVTKSGDIRIEVCYCCACFLAVIYLL